MSHPTFFLFEMPFHSDIAYVTVWKERLSQLLFHSEFKYTSYLTFVAHNVKDNCEYVYMLDEATPHLH